jgi:hypothetical protein
MRVASADIQQELPLSYVLMPSSTLRVSAGRVIPSRMRCAIATLSHLLCVLQSENFPQIRIANEEQQMDAHRSSS